MGLLVVAEDVQAERIPPQDHVAQRHRVEAADVAEPGGEPAVELEGAPAGLDPAPGDQRERAGGQADERGGCRPGIAAEQCVPGDAGSWTWRPLPTDPRCPGIVGGTTVGCRRHFW